MNKNIKCDVTSCKHNDCDNKECVLDSVCISCVSKDVTDKCDTICDSYKKS